jgi:hypothetical protein
VRRAAGTALRALQCPPGTSARSPGGAVGIRSASGTTVRCAPWSSRRSNLSVTASSILADGTRYPTRRSATVSPPRTLDASPTVWVRLPLQADLYSIDVFDQPHQCPRASWCVPASTTPGIDGAARPSRGRCWTEIAVTHPYHGVAPDRYLVAIAEGQVASSGGNAPSVRAIATEFRTRTITSVRRESRSTLVVGPTADRIEGCRSLVPTVAPLWRRSVQIVADGGELWPVRHHVTRPRVRGAVSSPSSGSLIVVDRQPGVALVAAGACA